MCTSLFLYDLHPALLLLLAFNRDEFWDRPTHPAHFWPDEPQLLAGRDALRNGTWLGMTKHGRFAFLTNYREPMNPGDPGTFVKTTAAPSRGALTTDFLTGTMPPLEYLQGLDYEHYCGFNLLVGDLQLQQVAYVSNRGQEAPKLLPPGAYGVSNGLLQQWPKVHRGIAALKRCLSVPAAAAAAVAHQQQPPSHVQSELALASSGSSSSSSSNSSSSGKHKRSGHICAAAAEPAGDSCTFADADAAAAAAAAAAGSNTSQQTTVYDDDDGDDNGLPWHMLFNSVMGDRRTVGADEELPLTGVGEALDHRLSAIFVEPFEMQPGSRYGTRSQTVIAVWRDGHVEQRERYVEKVAGAPEVDQSWVWKEMKHTFQIDPVAAAAAAAAAGGGPGGPGPERSMQQQQQQFMVC